MTKKDFPIKIGDKEYLLRFNFNAMAYVEDISDGKPFFDVLKKTSEGSLSALRLLLTAGLRQHHKMTLEVAGNLIDECENLSELLKTVVDAVNNYFSKSKPEDADVSKKNEVATSTSQTAV